MRTLAAPSSMASLEVSPRSAARRRPKSRNISRIGSSAALTRARTSSSRCAPDPRLDEQPQRRRVRFQVGDPAVGADPGTFRHVAVGVEQLDLLGDLRRQVLVEQGEQKVVLAAEVVVHGALREPGPLGDVVERGRVDAPVDVRVRRSLEQLRAGARATGAAVELTARHV